MSVSLLVFFVFVIMFFMFSSNVLISLVLLEILSFFVFYFLSTFRMIISPDHVLLALFSLFVIEGVIGLSCFISLVSFTGSDYVRSSTLLKC